MEAPLETITLDNGNSLEIYHDEDCENPRENDNLEKMICFHRRYDIGDKHDYNSSDFSGWNEVQKQIEKDYDVAIIMPLYLYDHSGISISTSHIYPYNDPWDAGQVGFVFISKKDIRENWSVKRISPKLKNRVEQYVIDQVKEYDLYVRGETYGYVEKNPEGEIVDSCGGFIGFEAIKLEKNLEDVTV